MSRTKGEWKTEGTDIVNEKDQIIADCEVNDEYNVVPIEETYSNAAFICKAVNNHDKLIETLKSLLETEEPECRLDHNGCCQAHYLNTDCRVKKAFALINAL